MDSKSNSGDDLKLFCQDFGEPEKLTTDGSEEQACKGGRIYERVPQERHLLSHQ